MFYMDCHSDGPKSPYFPNIYSSPKDVNGSFCHHLVCNSVLVSWYSHQYFLISCCYDSGFDPHHPHYRSTINICRESWFGSLIRSYCHKDREHLGFYKPLNSLCLQYFNNKIAMTFKLHCLLKGRDLKKKASSTQLLNSTPVTVIKCLDRRNLKKKGIILVQSLRV